MRRRMLLLGLAIVTVLFLLNWSLRLCMGRMDRIASSSSLVNSQANLILDAGHGGEDGGAVSLTGMPESQINLAVVLRMRDILAFYGVSPMVLREEDISLHDNSAVSLREKKVSDLKIEWLLLRDKEAPLCLVSIRILIRIIAITAHRYSMRPQRALRNWRNIFRR